MVRDDDDDGIDKGGRLTNNPPSMIGLGGNSNLGGLPIQFFGQMGTGQLTFASEHMGNEISVIR